MASRNRKGDRKQHSGSHFKGVRELSAMNDSAGYYFIKLPDGDLSCHSVVSQKSPE
ncbi:hypothetical protein DPMN_006565 [Dreissena polymorpha]|uniref:Uncharacterized protein n=1 Tax=Dreissena polymorpha TaxID=45954 RepID=A0A9D4MRN9_DREPO|nr:hypothetical protein DPMN_006565 [Dreissena polymorpha]